jgi:hypothetical protein
VRRLTVLPSEADGHVEAELPWYVNATLDAADRAYVEEHLASCARCRASYDLERRLAGILKTSRDTLEYAPQSGWTQLAPRLAGSSLASASHSVEAPGPSAKTSPPEARGRRRLSPLIAGILLAQAAAIGILSFLLMQLITVYDSADFRTLTQPYTVVSAPERATIRIVFAEETSAAQIGSLLHDVGGTITAGPSAAGVYTISLQNAASSTSDNAAYAADWLRAQPGVLFAEPVGPPAAP